jgi:predicted ATP-dependent serine protease
VGRELQDRQHPALYDRGEHFLTPRQLSEHPRGLIGRGDELASIVGDTRHTLTVISGKAGIGKTVLAILAAHSLAVNFPDGQLYINLRTSGPSQPATTEHGLRKFLTALGLDEATLPPDTDACQKLYRAMTANKSMLIVLEDPATAAQVRPLLPQTSTCRPR